MFWQCLKLFRYWKDIPDTISSVFLITFPLDPVTCLLGSIGIDDSPDLYSSDQAPVPGL